MTGACTDIGIALGQEFRLRVILPFRKKLFQWWKRSAYQTLSDPTGTEDRETAQANAGEISIAWRLYVLVPLLFGFLIGAFFGCLAYSLIKNKALLVPAVFIGIIGFIYVISTTVYMAYKKVKEVIPMPEIPLTTVNVRTNKVVKLNAASQLASNFSLNTPTPSTTAANEQPK